MAESNSTHSLAHPKDYGAVDGLWRQFYAISGYIAGAEFLLDGRSVDGGLADKNRLSGLLIAIEHLAAEGERMAAELRDNLPTEED